MPFAVKNSSVQKLSSTKEIWLGKLDPAFAGVWTDLLIAMVIGFK